MGILREAPGTWLIQFSTLFIVAAAENPRKWAVLRIWPLSAVKSQVAAVIRRPAMVKSQQHDAICGPADVIRRPHMVIIRQHMVIRRMTDAIS